MGYLKFLGRGSAFNCKEGNTSAFTKGDDYLLLIDCGENIFERIIKSNLLEGINKIYVLITHLHPDHVGSLGTLIFYCYYIKDIKLNIIYKDITTLEQLLQMQGADKSQYNIDACCKISELNKVNIDNIDTFKTEHVTNMKSYGYKFNMLDGSKIIYLGDTNNLPDNLIEDIKMDKNTEIYVDTCLADYPNSPHLSISKLCKKVPKELRQNIYCIHYDSDRLIEAIKIEGFNVVENII